jgi:hypothetical protein
MQAQCLTNRPELESGGSWGEQRDEDSKVRDEIEGSGLTLPQAAIQFALAHPAVRPLCAIGVGAFRTGSR